MSVFGARRLRRPNTLDRTKLVFVFEVNLRFLEVFLQVRFFTRKEHVEKQHTYFEFSRPHFVVFKAVLLQAQILLCKLCTLLYISHLMYTLFNCVRILLCLESIGTFKVKGCSSN